MTAPPLRGAPDVSIATTQPDPAHAQRFALLIGIAGWVAVMLATWPAALSFQDDVGYVGEAKLLLAGRVLPLVRDVGVWVVTGRGAFPKYPLIPSILLVPLVAISPRLAFALGMAAAICLALIARGILRAWGRHPAWALVVLAHPTVVILARTVTADLPLAAFTVGAWWAWRRERRVIGAVLLAALVAVKAVGFVVGGFLVAGELLTTWRGLLAREREAWLRAGGVALGYGLGLALVLATNEVSAHQLWFAYDHRFLGTPPFWFTYFRKSGVAQARNVLLVPPLLIAGLVPYWRRREWGPLLLITGFGGLMCFYFFVDFGTSWVETLVLAPRLVLPLIAFLLIGYADLLAGLCARLAVPGQLTSAALVTAALVASAGVSFRHQHWQAPMKRALDDAELAARLTGSRDLGVTFEAAKVGVLFNGPTHLVERNEADTDVVLCSTRSGSYRQQSSGGLYSCDFPGYLSHGSFDDYVVLMRDRADSARP